MMAVTLIVVVGLGAMVALDYWLCRRHFMRMAAGIQSDLDARADSWPWRFKR